ncbi:MAG: hypothetical protein JW395_1707 [Nitrospira sp.]|nr:hypothetical protein [Nitrospira sp.]
MVLSSSPKMRTEKHKRIVITTPYKYEDDRIVNEFVEMFRAAPLKGLGIAETFDTIVPFSQSRLQEKLLPHIIHNGS